MSRHDDSVTLHQMLDHIEEAIALAVSRKRSELDADRVLFLALVKLVEIVGEAATRASDRIRAAHPEVPWREVMATRNRLVHGYDSVDCDVLWEIVTTDFPVLAAQVRAMLAA